MKWLLLIVALPALAASPKLPANVTKPRLVHQAGSKLGALQRTPYTRVVRSAAKAMRLRWTHYGPGSQFISFNIYASNDAKLSNASLIGSTTNTFFDVPFTKSMQVFGVKAKDKELPMESGWWVK